MNAQIPKQIARWRPLRAACLNRRMTQTMRRTGRGTTSELITKERLAAKWVTIRLQWEKGRPATIKLPMSRAKCRAHTNSHAAPAHTVDIPGRHNRRQTSDEDSFVKRVTHGQLLTGVLDEESVMKKVKHGQFLTGVLAEMLRHSCQGYETKNIIANLPKMWNWNSCWKSCC